jgi:NAD(P)-dependent dehydrogenase (short-subunit alcohol dehydrogenase family)
LILRSTVTSLSVITYVFVPAALMRLQDSITLMTQTMVDAVLADFGTVDILINNGNY